MAEDKPDILKDYMSQEVSKNSETQQNNDLFKKLESKKSCSQLIGKRKASCSIKIAYQEEIKSNKHEQTLKCKIGTSFEKNYQK